MKAPASTVQTHITPTSEARKRLSPLVAGGSLAGAHRTLGHLVGSADYRDAVECLRDTLRARILNLFDSNWDTIRNQHHIYTIVSRAKDADRTLGKFKHMLNERDGAGERKFAITTKNFFQYIPDLAAARLVVVDAEDIFNIAQIVRKNFVSPYFERPLQHPWNRKPYRVRHSKMSTYDTEKFKDAGYELDVEDGGYCSVHFVFKVGREFFNIDAGCEVSKKNAIRTLDTRGVIPRDGWNVEIQIRTLMDEAWSETDHFVRYRDPKLRKDIAVRDQFAALSAYLQAANHHVSLIRKSISRTEERRNGNK